MQQDRRTAVAFRLFDDGSRVVDVRDVIGRVRDLPDVVQQCEVQHGRVEGAPLLRAVGRHRTGEELRVGAVDQVEAAVARQQKGVPGACPGRRAAGDRLGQGVQRFRQFPAERADPEGARHAAQCRQRVLDRQPVQQPVDRADLEG